MAINNEAMVIIGNVMNEMKMKLRQYVKNKKKNESGKQRRWRQRQAWRRQNLAWRCISSSENIIWHGIMKMASSIGGDGVQPPRL
jgi:hypothetical protein